ncbi:NAD(P)/FAD-dependent oxidoreductase [Magnetospira sp. QH-2]|uniref:NAD(P)/FAD-dependent oxidoreductase n=1 Tax=Magnetospira sp. (strain QH-2) TaxID=1288970 RepID=UPI0005FA2C38|nr:NAD(P)/FAD-dependent oxidoreductase [Magnetospira sp. QH-2]
MTEPLDCAVIGAGVVGLAVARALALAGREVVVLERADAIGTQTSARNSEVIHAGIYYPEGSLKGSLCLRGKALLYDYLERHGLDHRRCGKLVVATTAEEEPILDQVLSKAAANGCTDLQWLSQKEALAREPNLRCLAALWSPSTGIFDTHGYMLALHGDLESAGGAIALGSPVDSGRITEDGILLRVGGRDPMELLCRSVVNAAGLWAQPTAAALEGMPPEHIPPRYFCKGNYFSLAGKAPFESLVYPVPGAASLGCHYTRDLGGQGRFGPDVEWVEDLDYQVDPNRADSFYDAIRRYWPDLPDGALQPGYCGIRPKIQAPGEAAQDFLISGPETHGIAGLVHLFGIESPGLTASLAIGERVAAHLASN